MAKISITQSFDAPAQAVREEMRNVRAFTEASGFDEVEVEDDEIHITNHVGLLEIQLDLAVVEDSEEVFEYEQRDGIFEEMQTSYTVSGTDGTCEVTAETEFALDVALVGQMLDATVIKRQREREITSQFDWLEQRVTSSPP